jgi:hypothetical protein
MVQFKGFKITVRVNGHDLTEYEADNDDDSEANVITKYIEVKGGTEFSISCATIQSDRLPGNPKATGVAYQPFVDGKSVYCMCLDSAPWQAEFSHGREIKGGRFYQRRLQFSDLQIGATPFS